MAARVRHETVQVRVTLAHMSHRGCPALGLCWNKPLVWCVSCLVLTMGSA